LKKEYKGHAKKVIMEIMEFYKGINPEALEAVNGVKILRPNSYYIQ